MSNEHTHGPAINTLDEKKKKSMTNRIVVGVILAVTCIPALVVGSWFWFAVVSVFFLFAVYEILSCRGKKYHWFIWGFTFLITIVYMYWFLVKNNISEYLFLKDAGIPEQWSWELERWYAEPALSIYAAISALGVYFVISLVDKDFDFFDVLYFFAMTILVGLGFQCMLFLRYHPFNVSYGVPGANPPDLFKYWHSAILFIFVVIATFGNDTMAYFTGVFFGKHKMTPRVSPNKTWEGFFGGWILGGGLALAFALLCDNFGFPMLPGLQVFGTAESKWYGIVILSFGLPLIGMVGDLTFSLIKRYLGVKDYGKLLGAHGGVLDRVDSLIFCSILCSILVVVLEKGWRFFA